MAPAPDRPRTFFRRESGCPVHFLWDGLGRGRTLVRLGFMALLLWGALATGASLLQLREVREPLGAVLLVVVAVWGLGQLLSFVDSRRLGTPAPRS
ncbi:MAG: hypothetical protein AB2A00_07755 [Myxococcota bacterium]